MCGIGSTGGRQLGTAGDVLKNAAKNVGTGPTPLEKELGDKFIEGAKKAVDTISDFVTSPEGTAITTGLLLQVTPLKPLGDAFILGGAGYAALRYLDNHKSLEATLAKDVAVGAGGLLLAPANPIIGVSLVAASAADAATSIIQEFVGGAAEKAGESFGKAVGKAAAEGAATEAAKEVKKAKPE
jgi:hypothetical protein